MLVAVKPPNMLSQADRTGDTDMLTELKDTLSEKGISFQYGGDLLDYLVKKSYSLAYGARNLRRQIQKDLEDPIASRIIDSYASPLSAISVAVENDELVITSM